MTGHTVPALLTGAAERWADRPFVRAPGGEATFAGLAGAVAGRAAALQAAGIRPGDRVAALSSNRIELLELILACGWMGAIAVPINPVTYLLGAMVPILLARPPGPQERRHRVRVANGAAPPPALDRAMRERFGFGIAECYASTETNCVLGAPLREQRLGWMRRHPASRRERLAHRRRDGAARPPGHRRRGRVRRPVRARGG